MHTVGSLRLLVLIAPSVGEVFGLVQCPELSGSAPGAISLQTLQR